MLACNTCLNYVGQAGRPAFQLGLSALVQTDHEFDRVKRKSRRMVMRLAESTHCIIRPLAGSSGRGLLLIDRDVSNSASLFR